MYLFERQASVSLNKVSLPAEHLRIRPCWITLFSWGF